MIRQLGLASLAAALFAVPSQPAGAQAGGSGFLFRAPRGSVSFSAGWALASAHSDLFDFTTSQLTLNRGDFNSIGADVDVTLHLAGQTNAMLSIGVAGTSKPSEFRDFVDNEQLPIEQRTLFLRVPITAGIKQYLVPQGRSVGRFAWIPTRFAPFVGAGGGAMYYRFHQQGDFIDFQTMDVFPSQLLSDGWSPTVHALAGFDYSVGPHVALTVQGRYRWSRATLSSDFANFERLDLSGLSTTAGLTVRF